MTTSLRTRIALLAITISIVAALVAAFVPDYVYALRDYLFLHSLTDAQVLRLESLIDTLGKCSPQVTEFKHAHGGERWELNYNLALTVLIAITATICATFAVRTAGAIAAPIEHLSRAAKTIAGGERDNRLLPSAGGAREIAALIEDFRSMTESLRAADNDLRLRSSGISHELRTPLAVIRGRLIGVQSGVFVADAHLIEGLLRQVGLIERLATDLELLCDNQGLGFSLDRAPVLIGEVAAAVVDSLAPLAESVEVDIVLAPPPSIVASVDSARLERAISNLVENAVHHSGCRTVRISVADADDAFVVVVEDDGKGWGAEDLEALTQPFVTGESQAHARSLRTGLGLAIVKAIARAHHGMLSLDGSSMGGARATLRLRKA